MVTCRSLLPSLLILLLVTGTASARQPAPGNEWYNPDQPYVKVAVTVDGVYRMTGADLVQAGVPLQSIDAATLQLFENGKEIPLRYEGISEAMQETDGILFVGRRNRGDDERWAYNGDPVLQSSAFRSLYTDTTYYWLTWGGRPGLRYETPTPASGATTITAARDTVHLEEDKRYYYGDSQDAGNPLYTRGEGYYWTLFSHQNTQAIEQQYPVSLPGLLASGDSLRVRVKLSSETISRHRVTLEAQLQGGVFRQIAEADWTGYTFATLEAAFPQDQIPQGAPLQLKVISHNEFGGNPNHVLLDWIEVSYVRALEAPGGAQQFRAPGAGAFTYALTGYIAPLVLVLNPEDGKFFNVPVNGGTAAFSDAPSPDAVYWAVQEDQILAPDAVFADQRSNLASVENAADYIILTTPMLTPSAEMLAAYRSAHDGLAAMVVDVQDVFDEFDAGRPTPIAIRRFMHQTQRWRRAPRFLMLWGDAPYPVYTERSTRARAPWEVPAFGYAPSDGWYAMQTKGENDWTEALAVGRVTARTHEDGVRFLEKLTDYEAAPIASWQKRMLLLAGGSSDQQQLTLQEATLSWGNMAAAPPSGMDTLYFFKRAFEPLDPTFQDSIRAALREGASWLSYFGHSAAQTWEIVTDPPEQFDNAGRLPFVVSLGCLTGAFAGGRFEVKDLPSYGEQLVVGTLDGAIAHWGSSDRGAIVHSTWLSDQLHRAVFQDTLRTAGVAARLAKERFAANHQDQLSIRHLLQYSLLGDPATRLNLPTAPDFHVSPDQIAVAPLAPTPADSMMTATVRLENRGLVPADSVEVLLVHTSPTGDQATYAQRIPPFALRADATFFVRLGDGDTGDNRLQVRADPANQFVEENELNNEAAKHQVVFSSGMAIVAPQPQGIVNRLQPRLRVGLSSTRSEVGIVLEIDTSSAFAAPRTYAVSASGTYADWTVPQPLEDGRTYHWRARIDDPAEPENWQASSFTVRTDLDGTGWLQQGALFEANAPDPFLQHGEDGWAFRDYRVEVSASSERGSGSYKGQFTVNAQRYEFNQLGFGILVLDGETGAIRATGSYPTYRMPESLEQSLDTDSTRALARLDSAAALIRDGDYVFVRTRHLGNTSGPVMQDRVKDIFRALGSTAVDTLSYGHLWIMMARKGAPSETREWVAPPQRPEINEIIQDTSIFFSYPEGKTLSPVIGPAQAWTSLGWETDLPNETSRIAIDVLSGDGETVLLPGLTSPEQADLSRIDAAEHPTLRLRATVADPSQRATPQLQEWHVLYRAVPELILDPGTLQLADSLLEGEPLTASILLRNLGSTTAEKTVITFSITDAANRTSEAAVDTVLALAPDSAHTAAATIETRGLNGRVRLTVSAVQPGLRETLTYNNVALGAFYVRRDADPPSLQVLVEGEQLPNDPNPVTNLRDPSLPFVSTRPVIEIFVEDRNARLPLADTTVVQVKLDGASIPFSRPDLMFEPATPPDNRARLRFTPDLGGSDTTHTLQVFAQDASGNPAPGYQVHFRIQSAVDVETLYPYPNPMSSATTFAFQLRGADPSLIEDFRIRLYTVNGRPVREFDLIEEPYLLEGGGLRIGWNKLPWDGRDEDGDLLATGVYLYKVYLKAEGNALPVNNQTGIEKLVVIR